MWIIRPVNQIEYPAALFLLVEYGPYCVELLLLLLLLLLLRAGRRCRHGKCSIGIIYIQFVAALWLNAFSTHGCVVVIVTSWVYNVAIGSALDSVRNALIKCINAKSKLFSKILTLSSRV